MAIAAPLGGDHFLTCFFKRHRQEELPFTTTWGLSHRVTA